MSLVKRLVGVVSLALLGAAALTGAPVRAKEQPPAAPTFTVFATREGLVGHRTANGHRISPRDRFVALPSWTALANNGSNEFQVRVSYRDRSVVLPVWDVGPWNTHDDYWSPQRRYADLPVGQPMAQAAYSNGYNDGRDEFGRRIKAPNGIDIADGAFWDDLGMTKADWVQVSFLWMGGDADQPAAGAPEQPSAVEQITVEPNALVIDDGAAGYSAEAAVTWYDSGCGLNNRHSWTYGTADPGRSENRAQWTPALPQPGFYEVLAYIPACGRPATRAAHYHVVHDGATTDVVIDQNGAAGTWASLGVYHMGSEPASIQLNDVTGDDDRVVRFDAVKWLPRSDTAPPSSRVTDAAQQADGSFLVRWSGSDDISGVASYDIQVRRLPDGGWTDWQSSVTSSAAVFVPPSAGVYGFHARARDWSGNQESWRANDDIQITVGN